MTAIPRSVRKIQDNRSYPDRAAPQPEEQFWPLLPAWKIYLCLIVPITILLNLSFPNFHAPDDYDHVKRSYTLFHHPFRVVTPRAKSSGAMIDSGLSNYIDRQTPVVKFMRPLTKEQRSAYLRNGRTKWTGTKTFSEMPGALSYFPLLYVPQSLMLEIGRISGASIGLSVLWARFTNGLVGIALAALGLYLLPAGRAFALLLLLVPRSLMQFASNSADPILYGLALIIVALTLRLYKRERASSGLLAIAIFISASVRPPIAALALTPGLQAFRERRWRTLVLLGFACSAAAAWVLAILPSITDNRCGNLGELAPKLFSFASGWPLLIGRTIVDRFPYYYGSFVGNYAWGDGPGGNLGIAMPDWIYVTSLPVLALAIRHDLVSRTTLSPLLRLSLGASALISVWLTFLAMYVGCTVSGGGVIGGVQGRYFVPSLFAGAAAISGLAAGRSSSWPNLYPRLLIAWVATCAITMMANATQLFGNLQ
jgi:hypothetical protein